MRILLLDIETSLMVSYVWGTEIYKAYISAEKIIEPTYMLCWSAKWYKDKEIHFADYTSGHMKMMKALHKLLNEADVVVHFRGKKFDIPHINREFLEAGLTPPSPYKQVDVYDIVKQNFKFDRHNLKYLVKKLGLEEKMESGGIDLWKRVMDRDPEALKIMEAYNKQDVIALEELYTQLLPWIEKHPNHGAYDDKQCCPKCGSGNYHRRGYAISTVAKYARYQCNDCGGWFRTTTNLRDHGERTRNVTP